MQPNLTYPGSVPPPPCASTGSEVTQPTRGDGVPSAPALAGLEVTQPIRLTASGKLTLMVFPRQCSPFPDAEAPGGGYATHRADGVPSHTRASGIGGYATHLTSSGKHTRMISWQCSPFPDAEAPGGGVTQPTRQTVFPAAPAQAGPEVTQPIWTRAVFPTAPLRLAAGRRLRNLPGGWRSQPLERTSDEWRLRDPTGCSGKHTPISKRFDFLRGAESPPRP